MERIRSAAFRSHIQQLSRSNIIIIIDTRHYLALTTVLRQDTRGHSRSHTHVPSACLTKLILKGLRSSHQDIRALGEEEALPLHLRSGVARMGVEHEAAVLEEQWSVPSKARKLGHVVRCAHEVKLWAVDRARRTPRQQNIGGRHWCVKERNTDPCPGVSYLQNNILGFALTDQPVH